MAPPNPPSRILVIDDSPVVCKLIEAFLRSHGYQVESYQDPVRALQALLTGVQPLPAVLVVDLELPKMDGYEVITRLRTHLAGTPLPIIVLTRRDGVIDRLKARLAGATDYLTKPFPPQAFLTIVHRYTSSPDPNENQ